MSKQLEPSLSAAQLSFLSDLKKNWGWLLAFGIVSVMLGTIGLGMTFGPTLASVQVFGILLVVGGAFQLLYHPAETADMRRRHESYIAKSVPVTRETVAGWSQRRRNRSLPPSANGQGRCTIGAAHARVMSRLPSLITDQPWLEA
jgi:hypothetical protein